MGAGGLNASRRRLCAKLGAALVSLAAPHAPDDRARPRFTGGNGPRRLIIEVTETSAAKPGAPVPQLRNWSTQFASNTAAGTPRIVARFNNGCPAHGQRSPPSKMASDADTTYKATAPAVSSRALKCYTACYDGKLEEVKRVVNQPNQPKLDVNAEIHGGTAFAGAAVQNGHLEIVRFLCSIGADVDRPIHDGATPVFIAAYRGYVDIVKFLIEKGADLERPNSKGNTPFFICCQHCRLDIAELLADRGVALEPVNEAGSTPFFFACQEGNLKVVDFLAKRGVDCKRGKNGITPFHMACYRGHLDVVAFLAVERGLDARAIDGHGRTPLEVAKRAQRDDVVAFLERQDPELAKG